MTLQQAQAYYNTLSTAEKAKVDAAGGPSVEWLKNAVAAGVPDAIIAAGGKAGTPEGGGWEGPGGAYMDPSGAASSSEWLGKRMPSAQEFRKWAQEQHAAYLAGDKSAQDEDYSRYSDRQIAAWLSEGWDPKAGAWKSGWNPTGKASDMRGGGGGGGGGYGVGGYGYGTAGPVPEFDYTAFRAPSYEEAMADPGYQFALKEGADQLQRSAAAGGVLRTSGTLKDLINYGQQAAAKQYGDVYNRALSSWGANYQGQKDAFAPRYGAWETMYGGDLSKWTTQYGGDLSKYLQKEQNIYGLINQPPPAAPTWS